MPENADLIYCCLCASETSADYTKMLNENGMALLISQHFQIDINCDGYNLSKQACFTCCDNVLNFHNFFEQVQDAQKTLECLLISKSVLDGEMKLEVKTENEKQEINSSFIYNDDLKNDEDSLQFDIINEELSTNERPSFDLPIDWNCYQCNITFINLETLESHFQTAHNSQPEYVCTRCKGVFVILTEFETHIKEHDFVSKSKIFKCETCEKKFANRSSLRQHRFTHSADKALSTFNFGALEQKTSELKKCIKIKCIKRFECDQCKRKFYSKQHMQVHRVTCYSNQDSRVKKRRKVKINRLIKWKCYLCELFLQTDILLRKHFQKMHDEKEIKYYCEFCDTLFQPNLQNFNEHLNEKHGFQRASQTYECDICKKTFLHLANLKNHRNNQHLGMKKFACDVCTKIFGTKQNLTAHKLSHDRKKMRIECSDCGKMLSSTFHLDLHRKSHVDRPFACDICPQKFVSEESFRRHKENHRLIQEGAKEVVCDQCGKVCKDKYKLISHLQTHITGTPYACDQCEKTFKSLQGLKRHQKGNHTDVTYNCDICDKKFRLKQLVKQHKLRVHSTNYPYACDHCNKRFNLKSYLQVHLRQHTGEKPYACFKCNHFFTNSSNFIRHLKGKHGLKNVSIANQKHYPFVQ